MNVKKTLRLISIFFLFLNTFTFKSYNYSQTTAIVVISGIPTIKATTDVNGTNHNQVPDGEQWSYRLEIVHKGNKYYWASRENRELLFNQSGVFYNFIEPNGAGYIRVYFADNDVIYMEHMPIMLGHITYWGVANECSLPRL